MARNVDIEALTEEWEPRLRKAFIDAVRAIADKASIAAIEARLKIGDVDGAVRALGLDVNDFAGLRNAIADAYGAGGSAVAETIPAARDGGGALIRILFDIRSPRAEQWLQAKSSGLITEIVDDQRAMVRANLTASLQEGVNPRTAALDLVGKIDPKTKSRVGGVVGLTSQQESWQRRYAAELASTDPGELQKALGRGLRDKRFDGAVRKAAASGEPIPAATQAKMLAAYRARSLKYRGDVIARTETIRALGAAKVEAYDQAIERGQVQEDRLKKFWVTAGDERVRDTHRLIPGLNKQGRRWREPFATPTGPSMHAPHDRDIQCRCREEVRISYSLTLR
ncbi:MAG: phage minor head protein [Hyphomicrobium sp.]|uniref:phage minor head protein n=1 Tax=Hyphomicrobium sp. TaxID=82 RepID=UPI0035616336